MVQFALGTLDVDAALAVLPTLAELIHDTKPADADVLGEYTWYEKSLTGTSDTAEAVNNTDATNGWRKLFRVQMDSEDLDDVETSDLKFQTNKECWVMEDGATYSSTGAAAGAGRRRDVRPAHGAPRHRQSRRTILFFRLRTTRAT